ncbi:hypothetical protein ACGC1H_006023 [Rhizoctonia solani]|uniref:Uncharacterized protein n=1 Tax=Rhizoctonia solani TaxID=456999 RepID=A0A8H3BVA2_9AGAM|nr:unnamed protein product [Rhizoctonia solani]
MPASMISSEDAFVARVAAMEVTLHSPDSDMPANPILAAQRIIDTASTLAQIDERPIGSPLRQEVTPLAPTLKRNYGSLNLSKMSSSSSSSSSSCFSSPTSPRFPIYDTQEDDLMDQDASPSSSASNSPMLEFSTSGQFNQELDPSGVMLSNLAPEFVSGDESSAYLDFMDTHEDCELLGQFAETVGTSKVAASNTTDDVLTLEPWRPERTIGFLLVNPNHSYSLDIIEPSRVQSIKMASSNPLFNVASPRITESAWGLESLVIDSVPWAKVAPVVGSGSFESLQWIPVVALLALVANLFMGSVFQ